MKISRWTRRGSRCRWRRDRYVKSLIHYLISHRSRDLLMAKKTNKKKKGAAQNTAQSQNLNHTPERCFLILRILFHLIHFSSPPSPQEQVHTSPSPEPPAPPPPDDSLKRAERIKEEGNVEFRNKNYEKAIELYTNAIRERSRYRSSSRSNFFFRQNSTLWNRPISQIAPQPTCP